MISGAGANGFWYSRGALRTAIAVGLYSEAGAVAAVEAGLLDGRLPRARPEPRVLPNDAAAADSPAGWEVTVASAGAPDVSVEDMMSMWLVESAGGKPRRRDKCRPERASRAQPRDQTRSRQRQYKCDGLANPPFLQQ